MMTLIVGFFYAKAKMLCCTGGQVYIEILEL